MRVNLLLLTGVASLALAGCGSRKGAVVAGKTSATPKNPAGKGKVAHSSSLPLHQSQHKPTAAQAKTSLAVLTWHRIAEKPDQYTVTTPEKFAEELAFLHEEGANVIRLQDGVRMLKEGLPFPPRTVALGFDDGFKSCYTEVFPLLKQYNWPATLYVYPDWISHAKGALTWDELSEMQKSGLVDVQSHTMGHPDLVRMKPKHGLSYEQRLHHELFESKKILEEKLGTKVTQLAYPYGFYNKHIMKVAEEAGYESAWTVNAGPFRARFAKNETWMSLPRYLIYRHTQFDRFARYAFGKPLGVSRVYPAANSTIASTMPTISVRVDEAIDPATLQMRLAIVQKVDAKYNPRTRVLSFKPMEELHDGTWTVSVSARDKKGRQKTAAWAFVVKKPVPTATPAPTGLPGSTQEGSREGAKTQKEETGISRD